MKQTFVLQEVIDDLVNTDKSLSSPLMKLNYFGRLTKNEELVQYTTKELNGYNFEDNVPEYRKTFGTLMIDMQAHIHRHSGQLPASMIDEDYRALFEYISVLEGIAAVEKLAKSSGNGESDGYFGRQIPMEFLHILQEPARKLYRSDVKVNVVSARLIGNSNLVVEIPNAIRVKLLDFVTSIAESFGYDIEIDSFNSRREVNNQTIIHQMSTTITNSGDGNVINTGNQNQISNKATMHKGDLERLQKELRHQGIEEADIQSVSELVVSEKPEEANGRLGQGANGWISTIINKSLNGIGKISTGLTVNMLATLIKQYYGID